MIILIPLLAYLIGSLPSAYLIVRLLTGKNITSEGSGNVGAMNSYESTGKKYIAMLVFLADFLKGLIPILILNYLDAGQIETVITGICLIMGHNFSIFLKFKGGKGLATAVGVFVSINLLPLILWVLVWLATYKLIFKDINKANVAATLSLGVVLLLPDSIIYMLDINPLDPILVRILVSLSASLIMFKHGKDIKRFMSE